MIIDAHQHTFWHGKDDKALIADMDEQGIDVAWLLTWEIPSTEDAVSYHDVFNPAHTRSDGTHPGMPLSDMLAAKRHFPDRFVLGYCPSTIESDAAARFEAAYKIHGVRVCGEWKLRMLIDDPRSLELFRKAGELNCPVVTHLDVPYLPDPDTGEPTYQPEWYGGTVENLERALKACPDTIFFGHGPGFWREISGDADKSPEMYPRGPLVPGGRLGEIFADNPNLYGDLSAGSARFALMRDPKYARVFLCRYADRILFARDYYGGDLHDFLKTLELPQEVQDKIYFQNALALVGTVFLPTGEN